MVDLYDGLVAYSIKGYPNASFDILAVLGLFHRFFVAGFYYKIFKWPSWKFWSPIVRSLAGLGVAPKQPDPDEYDYHYAHTDILIVGAGPAGLMAALHYSGLDKKVILVEQDKCLGGSLLYEQELIDERPALEWVAKTAETLQKRENLTIVTGAAAVGYYDHNLVTVSEQVQGHDKSFTEQNIPRERFWHVRAKKVIIATGAIERPLVFPNNDRPGVMLASAVRQYANRYAIFSGKCVLISTK